MEQPVKENQGSQVPKSVATHDTVTQPEHRDLATAIREVRAAQENERKGDNIVADSSNAESRNAAPSVTKPESVGIPDHSVEMEEDVVSPSEAVHPRIYGEHPNTEVELRAGGGSSPYIRGTSPTVNISNISIRFIPVYTGNIMPFCHKSLSIAVHPRIYGEHVSMEKNHHPVDGSSPYIRGT